MTTKQVGWYDGERVHQMSARPVGDVPQHLAHTAGWVAVFVGGESPDELDTPGNRNPEARYAGYKGRPLGNHCSDDERLAWTEGANARVTLTPAMRADAEAFGACCDPLSLEPAEPRL